MAASSYRLLCSEVRSAVARFSIIELARAEFEKPPAELTPKQREALGPLVDKKVNLESAVLTTPEAASLELPNAAIDGKLVEIVNQFQGPEDYLDTLSAEGLTPADHRLAVTWSLYVEQVLERVADAAPAVSEQELRHAYEANQKQFSQPERRAGRHIMIVHARSDPDQQKQALSQLSKVRDSLAEQRSDPSAAFELLARHHSECPTALQGGKLGLLPRGQLYPELDEQLFQMAVGEVRGPIVTEAGTHLLRCEEVQPAHLVPFADVRDRLALAVERRRRAAAQRSWLAGVRAATLS